MREKPFTTKGRRTVVGKCYHETQMGLKETQIRNLEQQLATMKDLYAKATKESNTLSEALHAKDEMLNSKDNEIKELDSSLAYYKQHCKKLGLIIEKLIGWQE